MNTSTEVSHKRFKLRKKLLSGTYTFVPETTGGGTDYSMDIKPRTNSKMPFMFLFEGKSVVGSVRRPMNSATFEVSLGNTENKVQGEEWRVMQRTGRKEGTWTVPSSCTGGMKEVAWKGTVDVAVDGISAGLNRPGYKLVDVSNDESDEVLAVFSPMKGLSKGGVLQLNVNWGEEFERMVILTFICLYDRILTQATDAIGRGAAGGF
ncbi:hypothetical protein H634G_03993 [Metarhizium anisopliae BRIP 53293]|uniref:Tubby C-terminal domain-containing protein n=1 Tax=Metarhizium anisopliae BRIP 53293 TaxID=1291518 RepID=A0A0D9P3P7_METAN|nr:hypothetical protein H634G_03993 [Metarhizium anisopliae BRIP 53293]KJK95487.1 hypothetical protein H633G_00666 [Metarhizium anisopliae BRIP 53284]